MFSIDLEYCRVIQYAIHTIQYILFSTYYAIHTITYDAMHTYTHTLYHTYYERVQQRAPK